MLLMSSIRVTLNKRVYTVLLAVFFAVVLVLPAITPTFNVLDAFAAKDNDKSKKPKFNVEEATITDIQNAIRAHQITVTELVHLYLDRIKAYSGVCVNQPDGILGVISTIPNAGQINAFSTLNLRPDTREALGFDDRKARTLTPSASVDYPFDNDPNMPDALEVAATLDAKFAKTGKLVGPLHGVVMGIKDSYDTFDMRTTSGADAFYANDRPPNDASFVTKLREAGAIIIGKTNLGEYQSNERSSFGGTFCNPYDTERTPGGSSSGSGSAVGANLVTCAIAEETGGSVRNPARSNNAVGIAATRELVTGDGMIQKGWNTRTGPICRTVEDVARVLDVYAGFDPKDEITAFSVGRMPSQPYESFAKEKRLDGVRIGVVLEYMDKNLFTQADFETIDIIDRAIDDLRGLGATIVDPGPHGALFQSCVDKIVPEWRNQLFISQFPSLFPAGADHIPLLVNMYLDPSLVPHTDTGRPSIRNLGPSPSSGDAKYNFNVYLQERGDSNIKSLTDLINKANFHVSQTGIGNRPASLTNSDSALTLSNPNILQTRFTLQMIVHQCFGELDLDAVTYPTSNIPPRILTNPSEPDKNDRPAGRWAFINSNGFPAITVPAGFTTNVFDRDADLNLVGPIPAVLPVGIDFLCLPFGEPTCFKIASAYESATHHRSPPPDFGPVDEEGNPLTASTPGKAREMPKPSKLTEEQLREANQN